MTEIPITKTIRFYGTKCSVRCDCYDVDYPVPDLMKSGYCLRYTYIDVHGFGCDKNIYGSYRCQECIEEFGG